MRALPEDLLRRIGDGGRGLAIAVLRTGALGDVLRTLPAVRLVRAAVPGARIFWVIEDRWASVLEGHRDLDGIVALPRAAWRRQMASPLRWPELFRSLADGAWRLRAWNADLALDFHGNLRSGVLGVVSGAAVRLGFAGHEQKEGNRWLTTHRVRAGPRRTSRIDRNLSLVRALGIATSRLPDGGLSEPSAASSVARSLAASLGTGPFAVLSPGASRKQSYKKPPKDLLGAAANRLRERGIPTLVTYGPGEREDAERVAGIAPEAAKLAPPTDLAVLAALLRRARLFVGGDTGPLHLACAVGCPVLGLYGPTDPAVNSPWGVPFVALHPPARTYTGIKRIDRAAGGFAGLGPEAVAEAVDSLLRGSSGAGDPCAERSG